MSAPQSQQQPLVATGQNFDAPPLLVDLHNIAKQFPGVLALDNVDFDLRGGEVHVLFGENGAGKSTLINVIAGTYQADRGTFYFEGKKVSHLTPHQARVAGISPVFQEFSLAPDLTVEQNLFLGREMSRWGVLQKREMRAKARSILADLGFELRPNVIVGALPRARQQMTEIAKALLQDVKVLILDEPTASLTEQETEKLFALIARLKSEGVGIIYVSHRMREIKQVGDRVTVLRDGRKVGTVDADSVEETRLVEMMTGRKIDVLFPTIEHKPTDVMLEVENLSTADGSLMNVSFSVRAGEIVGVAGLVGCGKSELARAVFGLEKMRTGEIRVAGKRIPRPKPSRMLKQGVCYFPSDRVAEGLAMPRAVRENASVAALDLPTFARFGLLRAGRERKEVQKVVDQLRIRPPELERRVEFLSGGNRQKVMLARGLTRDIRIFLFDEPTVGIDVGAKTEIYEFLKELTEIGAAVLLISSELPEVLQLSNRAYVIHLGRVVSELSGDEITEEAVLSSFFRREGEEGTGVPPAV